MPNLVCSLQELDSLGFLRIVWRVEQTEFDFICVLGEQGEVNARPFPRCPQRIWTSGLGFHCRHS
jgi:hypothetical protein